MDCPDRQHRPDDRRQGDRRKITKDDRGRTDADCYFPEMEQGMRTQPQRRGGPLPDTTFRPDHTDAERYAEEVLIENPVSVTPGTNSYHIAGAISMKRRLRTATGH
jgi:hypothetical protein